MAEKKEDHSRLMLLIAIFLLGYIFIAGGGFSKTGQLTREAYSKQTEGILSGINPHNLLQVRGLQQPESSDLRVASQGGSQYISYGPFCGCPQYYPGGTNYPFDYGECKRDASGYCSGECHYKGIAYSTLPCTNEVNTPVHLVFPIN